MANRGTMSQIPKPRINKKGHTTKSLFSSMNKRIKPYKHTFKRIQLKKIDIPVETSTCALGSQYQNGQIDNLAPKPIKMHMLKNQISSRVKSKPNKAVKEKELDKPIM